MQRVYVTFAYRDGDSSSIESDNDDRFPHCELDQRLSRLLNAKARGRFVTRYKFDQNYVEGRRIERFFRRVAIFASDRGTNEGRSEEFTIE